MGTDPESRFKNDVNIGDKVKFAHSTINLGTGEKKGEFVEGFVAKKGLILLYLSPDPIDSEVGLFKARLSPYKQYGYPSEYKIISRKNIP